MGQAVRIPTNERQRLLAVRSLNSIGSAPTPELATLAELAKGIFDVSYAAVTSSTKTGSGSPVRRA